MPGEGNKEKTSLKSHYIKKSRHLSEYQAEMIKIAVIISTKSLLLEGLPSGVLSIIPFNSHTNPMRLDKLWAALERGRTKMEK